MRKNDVGLGAGLWLPRFQFPPVEEDAAPPMEEAEDAAVQGANVPAPASNANQGA